MLALGGTLDLASAVLVRELLVPFARSARGDLVLDLAGLRYLDGRGLDALIDLAAWVRGLLVLRNPSGLPRLLLERTRVAELVPNLRVEDDAGRRWELVMRELDPGDGVAS